ncbi:uncharacterized protein LOC111386905 [Olea europaea var. sylvestris]|uniref:uncharacterized protein LOC111386905 n=1 Tax=Olea europaea var. sylvestris TaxID=158386 RepID=UPI000C1D227F|nr:uncharacterized protein LOC111386905 [Olea europaea var. sylvestris]
MEETLTPRKDVSPLLRQDNKRPREPNQRDDNPWVKQRQNPRPKTFTPLNTSRSNILMEIKDLKELKWPLRMRSLPENGDRTKYHDFHRDHGHTTEGCLALKQQIEALIRRGTINVIIGGTASGGDTNSGPNFEVKRILVDNGSAANVLSHEALVQMGISVEQLKPVKTPLQGFGGGAITPEGIVGLPMTLGSEGWQVTHIITFEVVRTPMAYNAIRGRPLLNKIRAVISTFHLAMKFPTYSGVGVVRGSQTMARQCYVTSVRKIKGDVMQLSELELELENRGRLAPVEELVAVHKLNVNPGAKPIKQRKRQFAPERREVIREEIAKLLNAQFIREVQYPDWLANVVLVKKAKGKWRVCIDFTDLNKACSKDSYPLPRIDSLVDSTSGHKLYSFLDAFSGYHQIPMATEDQEKTSFMADSAIYCYKAMPFGLKNAGATYQRLINKVIADLIGKTIEAYVDDMVVKSK